MWSVKSLRESTIYKTKLCKIKWHFSVFSLGRALTRPNTDLAFLGLWKSFSPPFFQHLSSYSVARRAMLGLWMPVWWPAESSCFRGCQPILVLSCSEDARALRKHCFCCLWVPYSLNTVLSVLLVCGEGSGSSGSACELLKRQTVCLKIWWAYGLLICSDLCALFSVSKELFWWCVFHYWGSLTFSQIHRV